LGAFDRGLSAISRATNIGFVEPGQNLTLSLIQFATLLLPLGWTLDQIASLTAMVDREVEIAPALLRSECAIGRDERRIRRDRRAQTSPSTVTVGLKGRTHQQSDRSANRWRLLTEK